MRKLAPGGKKQNAPKPASKQSKKQEYGKTTPQPDKFANAGMGGYTKRAW